MQVSPGEREPWLASVHNMRTTHAVPEGASGLAIFKAEEMGAIIL
jgi:hypothetical protein